MRDQSDLQQKKIRKKNSELKNWPENIQLEKFNFNRWVKSQLEHGNISPLFDLLSDGNNRLVTMYLRIDLEYLK